MTALDDLDGLADDLAARRTRPWPATLARRAGRAAGRQALGWTVRVGGTGAEKVGAQLDRLTGEDPRWRIFGAVPVGERGTGVDHLVIGPAGVFVVEAKDHPVASVWIAGDTFMINGRRAPYLRNSRRSAERAGRLLTLASGLPVEATGIVVPIAARALTVAAPTRDVHVVTRRHLGGWLRDRPEALPEETVEALCETALDPATWRIAA